MVKFFISVAESGFIVLSRLGLEDAKILHNNGIS